MVSSPEELRIELRRAGIANAAIDAAWPQWWSSEAEGSLSATAELTFTVARRLGLSPRALFEGEAEFVWRDEAKYKRLRAEASFEEAALTSFGFVIGRSALQGVEAPEGTHRVSAQDLREAALSTGELVDTTALLSICWGLGIPIIQLRVFPLDQKRMHAMTVGVDGRHAILLARDERYVPAVAFTLAHEVGHIMLGHLDGEVALVELEDPLRSPDVGDDEERAADEFALTLLTGQPNPEVIPNADRFSATQLAATAQSEGPRLGIDPGILALCVGHSTKQWEKAFGALKILPPGQSDVPRAINALAASNIDWSSLSEDSEAYLRTVMGLDNV